MVVVGSTQCIWLNAVPSLWHLRHFFRWLPRFRDLTLGYLADLHASLWHARLSRWHGGASVIRSPRTRRRDGRRSVGRNGNGLIGRDARRMHEFRVMRFFTTKTRSTAL